MKVLLVIACLCLALASAAPKHRHKPRYQDFAIASVHTYGPKVKDHSFFGDHTVGIGAFGFTRKKGYAADFGGHSGHGHGYHIQPYSYRSHDELFNDFGIDHEADIISSVVRVHPKSAFAYQFRPIKKH